MPPLRPASRLVVIVVFADAQLLDVAGPLQTLASANVAARAAGAGGPDPYRIVLASARGGQVRTSAGLAFETRSVAVLGPGAGGIDTLIVAGGQGVRQAMRDPRLVRWIARAATRARRSCSVCTGAFLLAEAGLLDGRRAATHWHSCGLLQRQYPRVRVEPDPIYVHDGPVWTSAGVTAGIDLTLALVEEDLGHAIAMQVARDLVVFLKRPGGQSQYSVPLALQESPGERFAELHAWMAAHLDADLRVERLAERAGMSPRTFARAYAAALRRTPAKTVADLRLEAARRALEETRAPLKQIAAHAGFGSEQRLRRAFLRAHGLGPLDYRRRFAAGARAPLAGARRAGAGRRARPRLASTTT